MAYPFGPPIAYAVFVQRLKADYGCSIRRTTKPYRDPYTGAAVTFQYVVRTTPAGIVRLAYLPDPRDADRRVPCLHRSRSQCG